MKFSRLIAILSVFLLMTGCEESSSVGEPESRRVGNAWGAGLSGTNNGNTYYLIPGSNSLTFGFNIFERIDDGGCTFGEQVQSYSILVRENGVVDAENGQFTAEARIYDNSHFPSGTGTNERLVATITTAGVSLRNEDGNTSFRPWHNGSINIVNGTSYTVMAHMFFEAVFCSNRTVGWIGPSGSYNGENCPSGSSCGTCTRRDGVTWGSFDNDSNHSAAITTDAGGARDYCTATPMLPATNNLQNTSSGDQTLSYSWNAVNGSGHSGMRLYVSPIESLLDQQSDINSNNTDAPPEYYVFDLSPSSTSYTTPAVLENGRAYYAAVTAYDANSIGTGDFTFYESNASARTHTPVGPSNELSGLSRINDTGMNWFAGLDTNFQSSGGLSGQDGRTGQEAPSITQRKSGAGRAGFDYTKISNAGAELGASASSWSCTRDNHTGLYWETKANIDGASGSSMHDGDDSFTWYNSNSQENGGGSNSAGREDWPDCFGYTAGNTATYCNTQAYVSRVNATNLCGFNDWRLPTRTEISSIIDYGRKIVEFTSGITEPTLDTDYFPATATQNYWTSSTVADTSLDKAWSYNLNQGDDNISRKRSGRNVILVRGEAKE